MTRRRLLGAALAGLLAASFCPQTSRAQDLVADITSAESPQAFSARDVLFVEVSADGRQLAETMNVYSSRAGVFIPLGEFSRLLGLGVGVFPTQFKAEGTLGAKDRKITLDLRQHAAVVEGKAVEAPVDEASVFDNDIYVRLDLLERLLPVRLRIDTNAQTLTVAPTRLLPFQELIVRRQRAAEIGATAAPEKSVLTMSTPYALASPPALDVNLGGQMARNGQDQSHSFDVRAAADLAFASFQGYVGSNTAGRISDVRVSLSRKDIGGHALGALGGTRAAIGDTFAPSMSLGAGNVTGRGVFYTTAPVETLDLSTPLNLRGELPLGEEVELYVNEVLHATQVTANQGRYEFLNIPLTVGLNTIRLVFYGPQGQRREEVKRINFGAGQVEAGKLVFRFGAVQQNRAVIGVGPAPAAYASGPLRATAMMDYGLSPTLTLTGGLARYTPQWGVARTMGLAGLRTSLAGVATQLDVAIDDQGGQAVSLDFATRIHGVSLIGRHAEYVGGFVDETRPYGFQPGVPVVMSSDLRADTQIRLGPAFLVPLSADVRRVQLADGNIQLVSNFRTSVPVARYYVSSSLTYQDDPGMAAQRGVFTGSTDVATLINQRIQVRGGVSYILGHTGGLQNSYANASMQLSKTTSLQVGVLQTFGPSRTTTIQASQLFSAQCFSLAATGSYEAAHKDWRAGLQLSFGLGYDPTTRRYRFTRPGVSTGGAVAVRAYVDANDDGAREAGEAGVAKVVLQTPAGTAVTGETGEAFATGLGDGARVRLRLSLEGVDDPFITARVDAVDVVPRPGRTTVIDLPMAVTSEVELRIKLHRMGAPDRPLAAVDLRLVAADGAVTTIRSDHDGMVLAQGLKPGRYAVQLDPDQAAALRMSLVNPTVVVTPSKGGFVRGGDILVLIDEQGRAL